MNRFARLLPFLRNALILVGGLVLALVTAYLTERYFGQVATKPVRGEKIEVRAEAELKPVETERKRTAAELAREVDESVYGHDHYYRHRIKNLVPYGDASLLCVFRIDFMHEFKTAFDQRVNKDHRPEPTSEIIVSAVLASLAEKQQADRIARESLGEAPLPEPIVPKAYELYQRSLAVDRESAIRLMDELLALPAEERKPLMAISKYRRARLMMSLEDWDALSDEVTRQRLAAIRADLESVEVHAREGSLDPAQISENAAFWLAYTRSMILPTERLVRLGESDFPGAARDYLRMPIRGRANAANSCLKLVLKLSREGHFEALTKDQDLRLMLTLFLASNGIDDGDNCLPRDVLRERQAAWLEALKKAGVSPSFAPELIALLQYEVGRWQDCASTASLLKSDDPLRRLLLSRCALRLTSDISAARDALESGQVRASDLSDGKKTPFDDPIDLSAMIHLDKKAELACRVEGELGMIMLGQGDLSGALERFESGAFGAETEYVAECLLTVDELKRHVDLRRSRGKAPVRLYPEDWDEPFDYLEQLLGARLMRDGRLEEALDYVSPSLRPQATNYVLHRRAAQRTDLSARERADSCWRGALAIRTLGERILHAPYGLSWSTGQGWYVGFGTPHRLVLSQYDENTKVPSMKLLPVDKEERERLSIWQSRHIDYPDLSVRDARYAAFRHALEAVALLPDNDPAGAMILQYAGNLLKYREPKAAVPAYRLLVTRFPQTPYGQHAVAKKWFSPERPEPPADILSK